MKVDEKEIYVSQSLKSDYDLIIKEQFDLGEEDLIFLFGDENCSQLNYGSQNFQSAQNENHVDKQQSTKSSLVDCFQNLIGKIPNFTSVTFEEKAKLCLLSEKLSELINRLDVL